MAGNLFQLIQKLSDGRFHSGTDLGEELNISRAAIWKYIRKTADFGLEVHSVRGKGYRLLNKVDLLDAKAVNSVLRKRKCGIQLLEILATVDSTNSHAMRLLQSESLVMQQGKYAVFLAEQQTRGKGRRGRDWISPFGQNIYLTMVRQFDAGTMSTDGLSLVTGLGIIRALKKHHVPDLGIKWPNDILSDGKKLAGILLEITGDLSGFCQLLIGIGINTDCQPDTMQTVNQPWTDIQQITGKSVDRNLLVSEVIFHIISALKEFESGGLKSFLNEWNENDVMKDRQVELISSTGSQHGIARGIAENGALILETQDGVQNVNGGEISLRRIFSG